MNCFFGLPFEQESYQLVHWKEISQLIFDAIKQCHIIVVVL